MRPGFHLTLMLASIMIFNTTLVAQDCNQNKKLIEKYLFAISGKVKDEDLLKKFIADTDTMLSIHILMTESAFPKYKLIAEDIICEGDVVAIRGKAKGKHLGSLGEIPPTGKDFDISIMVFYRVENQKIIEHWIVADELSMLKQLGIIE